MSRSKLLKTIDEEIERWRQVADGSEIKANTSVAPMATYYAMEDFRAIVEANPKSFDERKLEEAWDSLKQRCDKAKTSSAIGQVGGTLGGAGAGFAIGGPVGALVGAWLGGFIGATNGFARTYERGDINWLLEVLCIARPIIGNVDLVIPWGAEQYAGKVIEGFKLK